jgi:hypothetical protein
MLGTPQAGNYTPPPHFINIHIAVDFAGASVIGGLGTLCFSLTSETAQVQGFGIARIN